MLLDTWITYDLRGKQNTELNEHSLSVSAVVVICVTSSPPPVSPVFLPGCHVRCHAEKLQH